MEEMQEEIILRGRLDGKQRNRLKRLLDMQYTPKELAEELGITIDQIYRVYVPLGCLHERDIHKRIQINGRVFANWYETSYKKALVDDSQSFCKTCKKAVQIIQGEKKTKGRLTFILSICPICGRKLTKILNCSRGHK
jgi:hypothetical protein